MANIILDFDGTIADTFETVVNIVMRWKFPGKKVGPEEIERLRNMPMHKILEEYRIAPWRVPGMVIRGRFEMGRNIDQIKAVKGMEEAVKRLHESGNTLYIVSTNSRRNIRKFLRQVKLYGCFKHIYGNIGLLGKAKALSKVVKSNKLDLQKTYYVGDEVRDIHAAKKAGIKIIGVSWGFNSHAMLAAEQPYKLVDTTAQLLKFLEP